MGSRGWLGKMVVGSRGWVARSGGVQGVVGYRVGW